MVLGLFSCFTAGCGLAAKALPKALEPVDKKRFLEAAKDGNEDRTSECLHDQPDLVLCSGMVTRKNAAHLAAEHGHAHILELLVSRLHSYAAKGLKEGRVEDPQEAVSTLINAQDNDGRTPLSLASEHGHVECARFLLANGADRLIVDDKGNTTLHYACWRCHLGVMFMLLGDQGEDPQSQGGQPPLAPALPPANANANSPHARTSLGPLPLQNPLNIIQRTSIGNVVSQGGGPTQRTPNSTVERDEQSAQSNPQGELVPAPARLVNMQNIFGFAPLQYASWSKQPAVVQVLLQYGADMLIRNPRSGTEHSILCSAGSTPLHLAAFRGHIEISRIFLKTFYERFLEPMLLAQASEGADAASITRSLRLVDPRTQLNSLGLMPFQVAHRLGFLALAMLLKPNIPIMRLFSDDERATRLYGPPPLKVICAEALNRKLLSALDNIAAHPPAKSKSAAKSPSPPAPTTQQRSPPHPPTSTSPPPTSSSPQPQPSPPQPTPPNARAPFPPPSPATRTRMAATPNSPNLPSISAAPNSPHRVYNQQSGAAAAAAAPAQAASLSRLSSGVALPTVLEAEDELAGTSTTQDARTGSRATTASRPSTEKQSQAEVANNSVGAPKSLLNTQGSSDAPSESVTSPLGPGRVGFHLQEEATQQAAPEGESPPISHSTSHADHLNVVNAAFLGLASQASTNTSAQSRSGPDAAPAESAVDSGTLQQQALPPQFLLNAADAGDANASGANGAAGVTPTGASIEGACVPPPSLTLWGRSSAGSAALPNQASASLQQHASEATLMQQVTLQPTPAPAPAPAPPPSPFAAVASAPPASASDAGAETKRNSLERNTTQSHSVNSTHGPPSTADRAASGMAPRFSNLPGQAMSSLDGPGTISAESQLLPPPPRSNASSPGGAAALARKSSAQERELARKNSGRTPSPGPSPPTQSQQSEQQQHSAVAVDSSGMMQVQPPQLHSPTPMRPAPRARKPGYAPFSCMRGGDDLADEQPKPMAANGPPAGAKPQHPSSFAASPFASAAHNSVDSMAAMQLHQQQQQHSPLFSADRVPSPQATSSPPLPGGPLAPQSSADASAMTSAVPGMIAGKDASQLEGATSNPIPGMGGLPRGAGIPPDLYRSASSCGAPPPTKEDAGTGGGAPKAVQTKPGAKQPSHRSGRGLSGLFGSRGGGSGDSSPTRSTSPFHAAMRRWQQAPSPPNEQPGPSSDMSAGTGGTPGGEGKSLRGSLRGMFNKEGDQQRTGRNSMERKSREKEKMRTSLSGPRSKRSGPTDPLAFDPIAHEQNNQENEEAHEALGAECGINEEGVSETAPGESSKVPRVYMMAQGSTVTLSQTPSMPHGMAGVIDEIVVRDVAGHNTGVAKSKVVDPGPSDSLSGGNAQASSGPHPLRTSHPNLPNATADVCMINSPLRMISRGSQESLFQATSLSGPQIDATGAASREGPSNNMLYNTHLPGEANKSASQSQVPDLTRAGSSGAAMGAGAPLPTRAAPAYSGELASPALRSMRKSRPQVPLGRENSGLARERSLRSNQSLEDLGEEHVPIECPSPGIAAGGPQPSLPRSMRSSANGSRRSVQQVDDNTLEVEEEEEECGVCMESLATLRLMPCSHTLCGPCAHRMCTMYFQRAPHCPFCRNIIGDISASCLPFKVPTE